MSASSSANSSPANPKSGQEKVARHGKPSNLNLYSHETGLLPLSFIDTEAGALIQVPQRDMLPEDARLFSPPPRRCSNVSAYSEHSTTSSMISDANLLSPAMYSNSTRSNSFASTSYSDDNETPPNEFLSVPFIRPHSTQSTPAGNVSPTILLSPVLSRPVRSQSAHSPPFLRSSLVLANAASDSDNDMSCYMQGSVIGSIESPLVGSRSTTVCAINEPHLSSGGGTPINPTGGTILSSAALGRFGSPTQHSIHRNGSSASDSGSMYGYFYKRQSFRSNRDSSNNNSLGSSLNIPNATMNQSIHPNNDSIDSNTCGTQVGSHLQSVQAQTASTHQQSSNLSLHRIAVHGRGNSLQRSNSEAQPECGPMPERAMSIHLGAQLGRRRLPHTRRPSACVASFRGADVHLPVYEYPSSNCSSIHASSSILRAKHSLGHSDPQLYTCSVSPCGRRSTSHLSPASVIRFRKNSIFVGGHGYNRAHRMSVLSAHAGPESSCSEPTSGIHSSNPSSTNALPKMPSVRRRRRPLIPLNSGEGASTSQQHHHPSQRLIHPNHGHAGARSGSSLAAPYLLHHPTVDNRRWSLASLPSSSGYGTPGSISALSSEYSSQEQLADMLGDLRFNNRYDSNDSYPSMEEAFLGGHRPRSRSLSSPVRMNSDQFIDTSPNAMSQLYKERFPKAKQQMESRLQQFLTSNAPLSGFTSSIAFNERPPSPLYIEQTSGSLGENNHKLPPRQLSCSSNRPSSPRPSSPCRPISPLATDSATAIEPGKVVFRSYNNSQLACTTPYGNSSNSIIGSFSNYNYGGISQPLSESQSTASRRSTMAQCDVNPQLLRVLAEGATRFLHHQICEIAADCLQKSRDDQLTSGYFCKMSIRLEETLAEAQQKTSAESLKFLASISKQLLMVVARTARLLESLEFDPDEFYSLLEETEGAIRYQLGAGDARVPDLPQYIIDKLGLNKNLITDRSTPPELNETISGNEFGNDLGNDDASPATRKDTQMAEDQLKALTANAPKEEDFENIRLISNGAYGAVYLVRHRKTRQRFALKKMKKQTLLLRNQVDQVYAERDILTFTDNPFVVCFYGSFETKQHLCMLMEYVEGGDCASLLKSAGVLPIEIARLYLAETILAIEYLHSCGIVHRDLKPDNLLITAIGHIKLTDFGLSKIGLMNRTTLVSEGFNDTQQFKDNQLCGTPEYIAPEVILRQGYGKPVDWWALGIILYEFLVGIVPFMGGSPEELFTNIINEEVEYPQGEEALEPNAESLIQMLLEKNPVDRLGTIGGAPDVASHSFFSQLDFHSLLRQKAEFVPNLENEEDTSYFDSRSDRYNHDAEESGDEEPVPMFWSFSTASPRHSITAQDIPMAQLAALKAAACSPIPGAHSSFDNQHPPETPVIERRPLLASSDGSSTSTQKPAPLDLSNRDSGSDGVTTINQSPLPNSRESQQKDDPTSPSAILLRQRFSAQRQANYSTSSSGTNNTGCLNTCSSTDSSIDASYLLMTEGNLPMSRRQTTNFSPLPRFAISSCDQPPAGPPQNQPRRATLSADPETNKPSSSSPNTAKRTESLRVFIPQGATSGPEKSASQTSIFYHAYPQAQASPDCQSRSSISSAEPNSPQPPIAAPSSPVPVVGGVNTSSNQPTIVGISSGPPQGSIHPTSTTVGKPVVIKKGAKGYGFTIRSVRVYLSADSDYYTIEHIVAAVRPGSPANEAGLKENDLITHVHTHAVHNMTHPQLMHRLLSSTSEITLHIIPLSSTTIKEGEARRNVGKLLRKKPRKPQRRMPLEKKAARKTSTLFRRLSGKRTTTDIVPGSSSQKQSFMPRSASSQDGVALSLSPAPMSQLLLTNDNSHLTVQQQQPGMIKRNDEIEHHSPQLPASRQSSSSTPSQFNIAAHRRASGHQILLPGVEEVAEPKMRRKHTTGSIASPDSTQNHRKNTSGSITSGGDVVSSGKQSVSSISAVKGVIYRHPPPISPIAKPNSPTTSSLNFNVPILPPPNKEPIQRPSSLLERKPSNTSQGTIEHKQSTASGHLRPTELTARPKVSTERQSISEKGKLGNSKTANEVPKQKTSVQSLQADRTSLTNTELPKQKTSSMSLQTDRPSLPSDMKPKQKVGVAQRQSIDVTGRQVFQNQPEFFYNDQPPNIPTAQERARTLPPAVQNVEMIEMAKLDSQVKRPPIPSRRLSPSRLVQRLFRSATASSSSSQGSPPNNQKS